MDQHTRTSLLDLARLLDCAVEARTQAQHMALPQTRLQMLKLAQTYEHMADVALQYSECRCEAEDNPDWTGDQNLPWQFGPVIHATSPGKPAREPKRTNKTPQGGVRNHLGAEPLSG